MVEVQTLQRHDLRCSPGLLEWLGNERVSLAVVAGGRLVMVSAERTVGDSAEIALDGVTAAAWDSDSLWVFDRWQLWRFVDAMTDPPNTVLRRFLLPQSGHTLGLVGASDLVITSAGPLLASALFGCLALPDECMAFRAVWAPPWITALRPEGRSGLSGVAVRDGLADTVTLTTRNDEPGADQVLEGQGLVISTEGDEVIGGLTAPRHPRWWRSALLVAEGGSGRLLAVDPVRHGRIDHRGARGPRWSRGARFPCGAWRQRRDTLWRHGPCGRPFGRRRNASATVSAWWTWNVAPSSEMAGSPVTPVLSSPSL